MAVFKAHCDARHTINVDQLRDILRKAYPSSTLITSALQAQRDFVTRRLYQVFCNTPGDRMGFLVRARAWVDVCAPDRACVSCRPHTLRATPDSGVWSWHGGAAAGLARRTCRVSV